MKTWRDLFLGRKFIVCLLALIGAFVLGLFNRLTGEYATVASVVVAAFTTADTLITRRSLAADNQQESGDKSWLELS